ncbi:MAG: hypothetical protein MHMPM18_001544 [Marteilia pararefringens]
MRGSRESHTKSQLCINKEPQKLGTGREHAEVTGENKQRVKERLSRFEVSQNSIKTEGQNSRCKFTSSGRNEAKIVEAQSKTQAHSSFDSQEIAESEKAVSYDRNLTAAGIKDCYWLNHDDGGIECRRETDQMQNTVEIKKEYTPRFKEFEKQVLECNNSNGADCKIQHESNESDRKIHNSNTGNITLSPAERQIDQIRKMKSMRHYFNPSTSESVKNKQRLQQLQEKRPLHYLPNGGYSYIARNVGQKPGLRIQQRPCSCRHTEPTKGSAIVPLKRVNDLDYFDSDKIYHGQETRNYYNAPVNKLHRILSNKDFSRPPQLPQHLIYQIPENELLQLRLANARSISNSTAKAPYGHSSHPMRLSRQHGSGVNHNLVSDEAGRVLVGGNNPYSGAANQFPQAQHQRSLHTTHRLPNHFDYSRHQGAFSVQQNVNSSQTDRLDKLQPNPQTARHIQAPSDHSISRTYNGDFGDDGNGCETQVAENECPGESVWGGEVGRVFDEANAMFPAQGRHRITNGSDNKKYGRNKLIANHIYSRTGKSRTTKQISSHVQVLKRRQMSGRDKPSDSDLCSSEKDKSSDDTASRETKRFIC